MSEPASTAGLEPITRLEAWQEKLPGGLTSYGAYLLLAVPAALSLPWRTGRGVTLPIDLSLCALAALWILLMFTLHPTWRRRAPHMVVFVGGLIVIMAALVIRDPWFGFFTAAGYVFSITYLPWPWRLAGITGTGAVAALSQTAGIAGYLALHVVAFFLAMTMNAGAMCALAWFLRSSDRQDQERRSALAELNKANERLVATIAENENLHRQLLVQAREAGVLDERRRMAREIHDTLAQGSPGSSPSCRRPSRPPGTRRAGGGT